MTLARASKRKSEGATMRVLVALCLLTTTLGAAPARGKPKPKPKPRPPPEAPASTPAPTRPAARSSIDVTVHEVAGTQAYLEPGTSGGVLRGAKVVINRREYTVTQTTASFAVIEIDKDLVREHDKGQASVVVREEGEKPKELPKPEPLSTWSHAWTELEAPASAQAPKFVPLGTEERDRRWDVRLSTAVGGLFPLGQRGAGVGHMELNARVHAEPFTTPFAFDLDMSLLRWFATDLSARDGAPARPLIWLRELVASYGRGGFYGGVGRMRYAASTLGALDGVRVRAPLGAGFSVGAFGGVLPDPLSGAPAVNAQRFGVEATYSRPDTDLRPEAAIVVHGTTFGGTLDERRISGVVGLYPGPARVGGHFELSNFAPDNPWKASSIELTAAGIDASTRIGIFQLGARADVRQPIRSRWLASYLPLTWFCRPVPAAAGAPPGPEVCDGSVSTRVLGAIDAGVEFGPFSLVVGGTKIGDLTQTGGAPDMTGGFAAARLVRIAKIARVDASMNYSRATYLDMFGGSMGPGVTLFDDAFDLSFYYRHATVQYRSVRTSLAQSGFGGTAMIFPSSVVLFTVSGEAITGDDTKAFMVLGTAMWRPRF